MVCGIATSDAMVIREHKNSAGQSLAMRFAANSLIDRDPNSVSKITKKLHSQIPETEQREFRISTIIRLVITRPSGWRPFREIVKTQHHQDCQGAKAI